MASWQGLLVALIAAAGTVVAALIATSGGDHGGDSAQQESMEPVLVVSSLTFDRATNGNLLLHVTGTHSGLPEPRDIYAIAAPKDGSSIQTTEPEDMDIAEICAEIVALEDLPVDNDLASRSECESGLAHELEQCQLEPNPDVCWKQVVGDIGFTANWLTDRARESGASWSANIRVPETVSLPLTVRALYVDLGIDCQPGLDCGGGVAEQDVALFGPDAADGVSAEVTSPATAD